MDKYLSEMGASFIALVLLVPILKIFIWILNALVFVLNFFPPEQQNMAFIAIAIVFTILVGGLGRYVRNFF